MSGKRGWMISILVVLAMVLISCTTAATPDTAAIEAANAAAAAAEEKAAAAEATAAAAAANAATTAEELAAAQAAAEAAQAEAEAARAEAEAAMAAAEEAMQEEVTLTVWYLSQSPEEIALVQGMSDRFASEHPGVTIDFSPYSFVDMNQTLRLALDGGVGPDVAYASPGPQHGEAYAAAGHLVDLAEVAQERGWTDNFAADVINYNNAPFGGKIFLMPFDLVTVGVYYNTEIFAELGLEEPTTFEEFETILATIKEAGITPIAVGALDQWPLAHIWEQLVHTSVPIDYIQGLETGDTSVSFDSPELVNAASIVKDWGDQGYYQDNILATAYADGNNLFITGEAAINIGGTWNNGTFSEQPEFEVGFFAMPQVNPDLAWHQGGFTPNNAWIVPVYSPNQDLAIDYVDFMLSEEMATAKWNAGEIPAYKFSTIPEPVSLLQAGVYNSMQNTATGYYIGNYNGEVQAALWSALQEMMAGRVTPEQAMGQTQTAYAAVTQ